MRNRLTNNEKKMHRKARREHRERRLQNENTRGQSIELRDGMGVKKTIFKRVECNGWWDAVKEVVESERGIKCVL